MENTYWKIDWITFLIKDSILYWLKMFTVKSYSNFQMNWSGELLCKGMNAAKVFFQNYVVICFVESSVFENHVLDISAVAVDENRVSAHWSYY